MKYVLNSKALSNSLLISTLDVWLRTVLHYGRDILELLPSIVDCFSLSRLNHQQYKENFMYDQRAEFRGYTLNSTKSRNNTLNRNEDFT